MTLELIIFFNALLTPMPRVDVVDVRCSGRVVKGSGKGVAVRIQPITVEKWKAKSKPNSKCGIK